MRSTWARTSSCSSYSNSSRQARRSPAARRSVSSTVPVTFAPVRRAQSVSVTTYQEAVTRSPAAQMIQASPPHSAPLLCVNISVMEPPELMFSASRRNARTIPFRNPSPVPFTASARRESQTQPRNSSGGFRRIHAMKNS